MNKQDVITVIKAIQPYIRIDKDAMINALLTAPLGEISTEMDTLVENALLGYAWRDIQSDTAGILPHWVRATIVEITHKTSSSGNPTWYCKLESDNDTVNGMTLYLGTSNGYANEAKQLYPQIDLMKIGDVADNVNITVYVTKSDRFLEMQRMLPGGQFNYQFETDADRQARVIRDSIQSIPRNAQFLDLETNGIDDSAEIVQVAIREWKSSADFVTYIKPQDAHKLTVKGKGGKSAGDINGITPEMLADKGEFPAFYDNIKSMLENRTVVTYGDFDVRILNQVCDRHGLQHIEFTHVDLMNIYSEYKGEVSGRGGYKRHKLTDVYKEVTGKELEDAHDALADVKAMIGIVEALDVVLTPF